MSAYMYENPLINDYYFHGYLQLSGRGESRYLPIGDNYS